MSNTAWTFPGQGSQKVGMGRDLSERSSAVARVFSVVDDALGFPLSHTIFNGPADELVATVNQQPAILAASIAYLTMLREAGRLPDPVCVAGHSLGEYSALVAVGALDLADAARLVRRRGELMEEHGLGGMIAVLGLDEPSLIEIAGLAGVEIANINAPGQTTLSGRAGPLETAAALARERGARRVVPLAVNGAFHSSLMRPVVDALRPMIEGTSISASWVPLVSDVDARLLSEPAELRQELLDQITASVRWIDVVEAATRLGATSFIEVGPGNVLTGLIRRIVPDAEATTADALIGA
ncbi:MAG TPA: ACP S-malonyltransferase [Thermomicrobiaceae bacterium]|nr:ACP S-malonyltransferase [Thermomicrobiaceae bacterium]